MTTRYPAHTVPALFPSTAALGRERIPADGLAAVARDWATRFVPRGTVAVPGA